MIALLPAGLAAGLALVIAVAGVAGGWIVTAAAALCVLALAVGWGDLLRLPDRSGTALLVGGLGVGSLVAATIAATSDTDLSRPLAVVVAVLAVAVWSAFGHELFRQDGRHDLVESVTGSLTGQIIAVLAGGWVLLVHDGSGTTPIAVAVAAVAFSQLAAAVTAPFVPQFAPWIGIVVGLLAALVASVVGSGVKPVAAIAVGACVAGVGVAIDRLFALDEIRFGVSALARGAAPVAAAGTVAYAVFRIGIG